jgi:hypothetical protein
MEIKSIISEIDVEWLETITYSDQAELWRCWSSKKKTTMLVDDDIEMRALSGSEKVYL